jgi:hypothetical protein
VTEATIAQTDLLDPSAAGTVLGSQIAAAFGSDPPDAVVLFAAPKYDHAPLLRTLKATCHAKIIVGCSSAGEFTSNTYGEGLACAIALRSPEMQFAAGVGRGLRADRAAAARELLSSFQGMATHKYLFRSALMLTDALAGHTDDLVEQLTLLTAGTYQFFGGGAGDNAQFRYTPVFYDTEVLTDAAVAIEILSNKPVGIGVRHGWQPASPAMRVTEAGDLSVASLNATPAVEVFQEHAQATGQPFDLDAPLPFFLHNIIGVATGSGHKLRVPLAVDAAGAIACAAEVPAGATAHIMRTTTNAAMEAAAGAARAALEQLHGHTPKVALFFDCAATRLRMGQEFGFELSALQNVLGTIPYIGCNTHGQIARATGQFSGFHNCTAVICIFPE